MDCPLSAVQLEFPASQKTTHGPLMAGKRLAGLNVPVPPGHAVVLSTTFVTVHVAAQMVCAPARANKIAILRKVIVSSDSYTAALIYLCLYSGKYHGVFRFRIPG